MVLTPLDYQKHTHEHLSRPQNVRQSRCLDRCLWVCHEWCQFLKSAGTVRSRFYKNRSKGYGDVAPSSEKPHHEGEAFLSLAPKDIACQNQVLNI